MIVRGLVSLFCTRPPSPPPNLPVSHTTLSHKNHKTLFCTIDFHHAYASIIYPKVTFPHTIFFTDWSSLLPFSWLSLFLFHTYAAWKKLTCFWILLSFNLWNLRFSSLAPWVNRTCRRRFGWCHGLWDAEVRRVPSNDSNHPYKNRILHKKASIFGDTPFMETPRWRIQQFFSSDQSVKQCSGPFSQLLEPTASVGSQLRVRLVDTVSQQFALDQSDWHDQRAVPTQQLMTLRSSGVRPVSVSVNGPEGDPYQPGRSSPCSLRTGLLDPCGWAMRPWRRCWYNNDDKGINYSWLEPEMLRLSVWIISKDNDDHVNCYITSARALVPS